MREPVKNLDVRARALTHPVHKTGGAFLLNLVFQRLFGTPKSGAAQAARLPLANIQLCMREALVGCHSIHSDRLLYKIDMAQTPAELWCLRSDLHQCIAQAQTEAIAAQRINRLGSVFAGWVPAAQLTNIHPDFKPSQK